MVRASMKWLHILVLLISFRKKITKLNFTPKIEREKFDKIQPLEKKKKKKKRRTLFCADTFPRVTDKISSKSVRKERSRCILID